MAKKKGGTRVVIYSAWCKGCGVCAAFCPGQVIEMGPAGKAVIAREEQCMNCGFCEMHCPDFAISVTEKSDTAAAFARDVRATGFKAEPDDDAGGRVTVHDNGDGNGNGDANGHGAAGDAGKPAGEDAAAASTASGEAGA